MGFRAGTTRYQLIKVKMLNHYYSCTLFTPETNKTKLITSYSTNTNLYYTICPMQRLLF